MPQTKIDHAKADLAAAETSAFAPEHGITIQDASAWILRVGVVTSVAVMVFGVVVSFIHNGVTVDRMEHATFEYHPRLLWHGLRTFRGQAIIELGIYLLVLTPIMRVVTSMILFLVEEHDWLYAIVTFFVLILTLAGLLLLK